LKVANIEPQNIEPQNIEPQNIEPQNIEPQNIEPQNIEPQNIEPQNIEPPWRNLDSQRRPTPSHLMNLPDPEKPVAQLVGKQLGDYRILSRLGRGGMAQVYLAEQLSLSRLIALKVLKPELAKDPSYISRFKNEARAAAALVHANIVQIFEVGECEGFQYIAQEYVSGMNLSQYLRRHGAVSPLMAVNVMTQIASALKKAKALGVVHRDIKPENIMLSTEGEVKVADFGLARLTTANQRTDLTQIGITMGTPLYMSPEQIEGGAVDHRADLYSFGVTCYHMLTGQAPFRGENPISVAIQHAKEQALPIADQRPDIPPVLIAVVEKLMEKKANDRFQDAGQVLEALREVEVDTSPANWQDLLRHLQQSGSYSVDIGSLSQTQSMATRRLETLMHGPRPGETLRNWTIAALALLVAPLILGAVWAGWTAPQSIVQKTKTQPLSLPRKETVADQYMYAFFQNTEEGWKSVIDYFDQSSQEPAVLDKLYIRWGEERLAEFYMKNKLWKQAERIYQDFAGYEPGQRARIIGDYGVAISQYHQGDPTAINRLLSEREDPELTRSLREHLQNIRREKASAQ